MRIFSLAYEERADLYVDFYSSTYGEGYLWLPYEGALSYTNPPNLS